MTHGHALGPPLVLLAAWTAVVHVFGICTGGYLPPPLLPRPFLWPVLPGLVPGLAAVSTWCFVVAWCVPSCTLGWGNLCACC